ncbi:hypothetical protein TWF788_007578 [Orbilia oligospora]|uniref:Uncharacterized protein n=2 Tax=Orbilia oligospora TaxID=2813651 RepID=A0A7C8TWT8_ORBOL|nr:hypothetical protein TWF788_007578 [Orbilia oligospora]
MMATVNVNLEGVIYTNLETPTPLSPNYAYPQFKQETKPENTAKNIAGTLVGRQQGQGAEIKFPNEAIENNGETPTKTTSTHTFSIVTRGFVVATFTAVGTAVSPPRGVPQPSHILPPWEIILIFLSSAFVCFILFRALYHSRRLEMMIQKEDNANGIVHPTIGNDETSNDQYENTVKMKNVSVDISSTDKSGTNSVAPKLSTKYIPKDIKAESDKGDVKILKSHKN